jgi:hypothetical protein
MHPVFLQNKALEDGDVLGSAPSSLAVSAGLRHLEAAKRSGRSLVGRQSFRSIVLALPPRLEPSRCFAASICPSVAAIITG